MMPDKYQPIPPKRTFFKPLVLKIMLPIVGRALQSAAKRDPDIKMEVNAWEEGFSLMMNVMPLGPYITLKKRGGKLKYRGTALQTCDVSINFKNVESAFMVLTPQLGIPQAYAERRILASGDLGKVMSFARVMNTLLAHLYPKIISQRLLKRVPPMGLKKMLIRAQIMMGMPFGL